MDDPFDLSKYSPGFRRRMLCTDDSGGFDFTGLPGHGGERVALGWLKKGRTRIALYLGGVWFVQPADAELERRLDALELPVECAADGQPGGRTLRETAKALGPGWRVCLRSYRKPTPEEERGKAY